MTMNERAGGTKQATIRNKAGLAWQKNQGVNSQFVCQCVLKKKSVKSNQVGKKYQKYWEREKKKNIVRIITLGNEIVELEKKILIFTIPLLNSGKADHIKTMRANRYHIYGIDLIKIWKPEKKMGKLHNRNSRTKRWIGGNRLQFQTSDPTPRNPGFCSPLHTGDWIDITAVASLLGPWG